MTGIIEDMQAQIAALLERVAYLESLDHRIMILEGAKPDAVEPRPLQMAAIAVTTAREYGIDIKDLRGKSKSREFSWPRQDAMLRMVDAGYSYSQIGRYFGRDHTTVRYALTSAEKRVEAR